MGAGLGQVAAKAAGAVGSQLKTAANAVGQALPSVGIEYADMSPADSKAVQTAANNNIQVMAPVMPSQWKQGKASAVTSALPGVTPSTYATPAARLKGDFTAVNQLADAGVIRRKPKANVNDPALLQKAQFKINPAAVRPRPAPLSNAALVVQ